MQKDWWVTQYSVASAALLSNPNRVVGILLENVTGPPPPPPQQQHQPQPISTVAQMLGQRQAVMQAQERLANVERERRDIFAHVSRWAEGALKEQRGDLDLPFDAGAMKTFPRSLPRKRKDREEGDEVMGLDDSRTSEFASVVSIDGHEEARATLASTDTPTSRGHTLLNLASVARKLERRQNGDCFNVIKCSSESDRLAFSTRHAGLLARVFVKAKLRKTDCGPVVFVITSSPAWESLEQLTCELVKDETLSGFLERLISKTIHPVMASARSEMA